MDVCSSVAQYAIVFGMYNRINVFLRPPLAMYSRCLCHMTRIDAATILRQRPQMVPMCRMVLGLLS